MTPYPNEPRSLDDWHPARADEVVRLARLMKRRRGRRQLLKAGAGLVGGAFALAGTWLLLQLLSREREYDFGGLTCSEALACADEYLHGRLPAEQAARVDEHVRRCPNCGPRFPRARG